MQILVSDDLAEDFLDTYMASMEIEEGTMSIRGALGLNLNKDKIL
jgi:hypothetical protein